MACVAAAAVPASRSPETEAQGFQRLSRDARITAFALAVIALAFFAAACALWGSSMLPVEVTMGFGMFYYLGGVFLGSIGALLMGGALVHVALASVHSWQKRSVQDGAS